METDQIAAEDGTVVPLRVLDGPDAAAAALLLSPAMGVPAARYERFAAALHEAGYHVMLTELRGVGDSPVRPSRRVDFGYADLAERDWPAVVAAARRRWPQAPIVLVGHSLGGQLSMLYAAAHPQDVAALALPAAGTIHWRAYPLRAGLGILAFTQAARLIAAMRGVFPGRRLGFGGTEARSLIRDWARVAVSGRWELRGASHDYERLLADLDVPTLSLTLEGDRFAPPGAAAGLTAKLANVDHVHLDAATLGGATDHLSWLKQPQPVAAQIHRWLATTLRRP